MEGGAANCHNLKTVDFSLNHFMNQKNTISKDSFFIPVNRGPPVVTKNIKPNLHLLLLLLCYCVLCFFFYLFGHNFVLFCDTYIIPKNRKIYIKKIK